jgi:hypothetical protein
MHRVRRGPIREFGEAGRRCAGKKFRLHLTQLWRDSIERKREAEHHGGSNDLRYQLTKVRLAASLFIEHSAGAQPLFSPHNTRTAAAKQRIISPLIEASFQEFVSLARAQFDFLIVEGEIKAFISNH